MHAGVGASYQYMLTVAHCTAWADNQSIYNGAGAYMGYSDYVAELITANYDLALIRLGAGKTGAGKIYLTPPGDNGFTNKTVAGYAASGIMTGAEYCVSARKLSPRCGVFAGSQSVFCTALCTYVIDVYNNNYNIFCHGDSGGPVYYYITGYPNSVIAAGLVKGIYTNNGAQCSNFGAISGVSTAIDTVGQGLTITLG
jgi:hypothetical protein